MEKIKCTIERITFQNPDNGYSVLQATIKGFREEQTIVGTFHEVTVGANRVAAATHFLFISTVILIILFLGI